MNTYHFVAGHALVLAKLDTGGALVLWLGLAFLRARGHALREHLFAGLVT
jgi:hypothetical protein